jgi:hypothetical protein
VQQIIGKGSLTIRGEYYWNGNCAAASTPSTTKFNTAAHTDGAQIAVGDIVLVTNGYGSTGTYKYYTYSTVKGTVDKGSNIWEIEVNDAADWGNIGSNDYYTIIKTKVTGPLTYLKTAGNSLIGMALENSGAAAECLTISEQSVVSVICCSIVGGSAGVGCRIGSGSTITDTRSSYFKGTYGLISGDASVVYVNTNPSNSYASVFETFASGYAVYITNQTTLSVFRCILYAPSGTGVYVRGGAGATISRCTIPTGTTSGIISIYGGVVVATTINNQATTPLTPAAATDPAYIYNA